MTDQMNGSAPRSEPEEQVTREPLDDFLYHQRRAYEEMGKALEALIPEAFRSHTKVAAKELVESFKVVLDVTGEAIEKLSEEFERVMDDARKDDEEESASGATKTHIKVE